MNSTFHIGASGLKYHQKNMDVLSNNMANVNTYGYKGQRLSFENQLYTTMKGNVREEQTEAVLAQGQDLMSGHGVKASAVDTLFEQGILQNTDNPMDYAIVGEGMFGLLAPNGEKKYTRAGNFIISMDGKKAYLKTPQGDFVTDVKGKKLAVPYNDKNQVDFVKLNAQIGIFQFPNKYALEQAGGNAYRETVQSGKAIPADGKKAERPVVMQNFLEGSSVDISQQMTDVIVAQKAFQFSAKVVQIADEMEQIVNTLR